MSRNYFKLIGLLAFSTAQAAVAQGLLIPTETSMGPLGIKYQRVSAAIRKAASVR